MLGSTLPQRAGKPASLRRCRVTRANVPLNAVAATHAGRSAPQKVAIFVEPSPFTHISGMKNRFEQLIKNLRSSDVDVTVVTPGADAPAEYCGAKVVNVLGFKIPFYHSPTLLLSLGISVRVLWHLLTRRPDIIHVSSPGVMVFAAVLYARLLSIPLVVSYHTHIPEYIPRYTWVGLVVPMWLIIRWCTKMSDLTLVTSAAMKTELSKNKCARQLIDVWQRGVDTEQFHPRFRCTKMRSEMTDGHVEAPLLVYVGRLGAEKNIKALKGILEAIPGSRLALVGDGPSRPDLEEHFRGMPVKFMGMLKGDTLSRAYASADIFLMPSETETLGFVVLEAMASQVPVVAVAAGGLTDIITQPGTTGMLYRPGNYAEAATLTRRLIEDEELRERVGAAGREEVCRWGWGAATRKLREQQYSRAVRFNSGRRRYWLLGLSIRLQMIWRWCGAFLAAAAATLAERLDYAHCHRHAYAAAVA